MLCACFFFWIVFGILSIFFPVSLVWLWPFSASFLGYWSASMLVVLSPSPTLTLAIACNEGLFMVVVLLLVFLVCCSPWFRIDFAQSLACFIVSNFHVFCLCFGAFCCNVVFEGLWSFDESVFFAMLLF